MKNKIRNFKKAEIRARMKLTPKVTDVASESVTGVEGVRAPSSQADSIRTDSSLHAVVRHSELNALKLELEQSLSREKDITNNLRQAHEDARGALDANIRVSAELENSRNLFTVAQEESSRLKAQVVSLEQVITQLSKSEMEALEKSRRIEAELTRNIVTLESSSKLANKTTEALAKIEARFSQLEAKYKSVQSELLAANKNLLKVESLANSLKASVVDRFRELAILTSICENRDLMIGVQQKSIDRYKLRMANIKQSISWKVTSPIRMFSKNSVDELKRRRDEDYCASMLNSLGIFDERWYRSTYADVAESNMEPVYHFVRFGYNERRKPNSQLDLIEFMTGNNIPEDESLRNFLKTIKRNGYFSKASK